MARDYQRRSLGMILARELYLLAASKRVEEIVVKFMAPQIGARKIVGKLGQHGFLEALEPKYKGLGDIERLSQVGLSEEFVNTIMDNFRFWQGNLQDVCRRADVIRIEQVMKPTDVSIDENASLTEAIHLFVMAQALSILVTRQEEVVGILRLSDLFVEVAGFVTSTDCH